MRSVLNAARIILVTTAAAGLVAATTGAEAKPVCVSKAGQGTNTTQDGARFQAYEAVLQATDWGMWSQWITGSAKIGEAPGYKVSNLKSSCTAGTGLGHTCIISARLCR